MKNRPLGHILKDLDRASGRELNQLLRPVVYVWFRGERCLYVGQSKNGISRVISSSHHVIGVLSPIQDEDHFHFYFIQDYLLLQEHRRLDEALLLEERRLINKFAPEYNIASKDHYKPERLRVYEREKKEEDLRRSNVQELSREVQAKAELADFLFGEVPDEIFLGDAQSCENLSTEQLEELIKDRRQRIASLDCLEKLNKKIKNGKA